MPQDKQVLLEHLVLLVQTEPVAYQVEQEQPGVVVRPVHLVQPVQVEQAGHLVLLVQLAVAELQEVLALPVLLAVRVQQDYQVQLEIRVPLVYWELVAVLAQPDLQEERVHQDQLVYQDHRALPVQAEPQVRLVQLVFLGLPGARVELEAQEAQVLAVPLEPVVQADFRVFRERQESQDLLGEMAILGSLVYLA